MSFFPLSLAVSVSFALFVSLFLFPFLFQVFLIAIVSFVSLIFLQVGEKKNSEMEMEVNQTKLELNVTAGEKKFGLASF